MNLEIIHVTMYYACDHQTIRPVRRDDTQSMACIDLETQTWLSLDWCPACQARIKRTYEARMEKAGKL